MDIRTAYAGTRPAEVTFDARVNSPPRFFYSRRSGFEHEAFDAQSVAGGLEIVDNVTIGPRVPVRPGDRIVVRGEMVHDPGRAPIVHWTHHDPSGRHAGGFIRLQGRVYA